MLQYGFELELLGLSYDKANKELSTIVPTLYGCHMKVGPLDKWTTSIDSSIRSPNGTPTCEIKSRVNPTRKEIKEVITKLKSLGCKVNKSCGLHIHISDTEKKPIRIKVKEPFKVWSNRFEYCYPPTPSKYNPAPVGEGVRQIAENHLEVRTFNAKMSYGYINKAIKLVKDSIVYSDTEKNEYQVVVI